MAKSASVAAFGIVLAALAGWFFFGGKPAITNYPSAGTDVVALGDSLVYGTGSTKGNDFVSVLSKDIGVPIVNLGDPGDTTADVLKRMSELDRYKPKIVIVLVGGNDYLRQIPDVQVFENLAKIIQNIQARGSIVVLVGIRGGVLVDPYAEQFKVLSNTYGTAYVPNALQGLFGNQELMADAVHPNDAGYKKLAERLALIVAPLLQ
jgi:acyl-CoA thioesterase I